VADIPPDGGSYALQFYLLESVRLKIGRLGTFEFPPGSYVYTGSALGKGGLRARINYHLKRDNNPHWHIDYLLPIARLESIIYVVSDKRMECLWNQALAALPGVRTPAPGFGARDCKAGCKSHLLLFDARSNKSIMRRLTELSSPNEIMVSGKPGTKDI
jgi:Uri superfamily endonuclease